LSKHVDLALFYDAKIDVGGMRTRTHFTRPFAPEVFACARCR
jgi:hypothetical protein